MNDRPRRSAGMRGNPLNAAPEHRPIPTTPKARPEVKAPERTTASRFVKPKVLMGEVTAPKGELIAAERAQVRAFMLANRLQPTQWAQKAGVAPGALLAFLAGKARSLSPDVAVKLAAAANASVEQLFGR